MGFWMRDAHIHHGVQDALTVFKPTRIKGKRERKRERERERERERGRAKKRERNNSGNVGPTQVVVNQ